MNENLLEMLHRLHAYLDHIHDRSLRALRASREEAKGLATQFVSKQYELPEDQRLLPQFAQFLVAAWALNDALSDGELSDCGDWIGWSLSATIEPGHEVELHIGRLVEFHQAPSISTWPGFGPTLVVYLGAFYYYARRRTAMQEIGAQLWGTAMRHLMRIMDQSPKLIDPPEVFLGSFMLAWAAKEAPERARQLTPYVQRWVHDPELPASVRSLYCLSLATNAGRYSGTSSSTWARMALDEFADHLIGEQKTQMLATVLDPTNVQELEAILVEMQQHQAKQRHALGPLAFARVAAFMGDVVQPYFVRTLSLGRVDYALRGLETWHQAEHVDDRLDPQSILLMIPFGETSYVAAVNGVKTEIVRDNQALLARLTRETDAFLGTAKTVAYEDNTGLRIPERPGVPSLDDRSGWFSTMQQAYCPDGVEFGDVPTCQLMLPSVGTPLQAVQLAVWGTTWPIAASLSAPRSDRDVRAVALWSGGGSMTEAMELAVLKHAFESRQIEVDIFAPESCSAAVFLSTYENPKYDVVWVVSHGEFDHWSPKHVRLQISQDRTAVSLEDLHLKAPESHSRRLLVLNVCDGGRFEETGMIPKIGLAPGLASPAQATISHLWPVMGFPSAALGAYLAYYLASGTPYFEAYKRTMLSVGKHSTVLAKELEDLYGARMELMERLSVRDEDFSPIQFSGSAAFFQ